MTSLYIVKIVSIGNEKDLNLYGIASGRAATPVNIIIVLMQRGKNEMMIFKCKKCGQLPDIHLCGRSENGPRAKIACCGFGAEVSAKTKDEALKVAVEAWNLKCECFDIGAKQ